MTSEYLREAGTIDAEPAAATSCLEAVIFFQVLPLLLHFKLIHRLRPYPLKQIGGGSLGMKSGRPFLVSMEAGKLYWQILPEILDFDATPSKIRPRQQPPLLKQRPMGIICVQLTGTVSLQLGFVTIYPC
jgi:hypothetical protein